MIPEISKRPFGSPLDETCLPYFCHPTLDVFSSPVRDSRDGSILAASGYWAVRFRTGRWLPSDFPEASPEFITRVDTLPWHGFMPDPAKYTTKAEWRKIDDARGTIYRGGSSGLLPLWVTRRTISHETLVNVCNGPLVPLALLQLLARLPRCELMMSFFDRSHLFFRFNGGEGIVAPLFPPGTRPPARFSLFLTAEQREERLDRQP